MMIGWSGSKVQSEFHGEGGGKSFSAKGFCPVAIKRLDPVLSDYPQILPPNIIKGGGK